MLMGTGLRTTTARPFARRFFTRANGRVFLKRLFARIRAEVVCLSIVGARRRGILVFNSHSAYWIFDFHLFLLVLS
jgi:hypothetical protein